MPLGQVLGYLAGTEPFHSRNAAWEVDPVTPRPSRSAEVTAGSLQRPLWDRTVLRQEAARPSQGSSCRRCGHTCIAAGAKPGRPSPSPPCTPAREASCSRPIAASTSQLLGPALKQPPSSAKPAAGLPRGRERSVPGTECVLTDACGTSEASCDPGWLSGVTCPPEMTVPWHSAWNRVCAQPTSASFPPLKCICGNEWRCGCQRKKSRHTDKAVTAAAGSGIQQGLKSAQGSSFKERISSVRPGLQKALPFAEFLLS